MDEPTSSHEKAVPIGLAEVLRQAYMLQVAENRGAPASRTSEAAKSRFWLNGKLMMAAVSNEMGPARGRPRWCALRSRRTFRLV